MNTQTSTKNVEQKEKIYMCVCNELPFIKKINVWTSYIRTAWKRTKGARSGQSFDLISNPYLDLQDFPRTPFSHCPWCTLFAQQNFAAKQALSLFPLRTTVIPRRKETIVTQNLGGLNKVYYRQRENGELKEQSSQYSPS